MKSQFVFIKFVKTFFFSVIAGSALLASNVSATLLTGVPMQGGMIMPMLRYNAGTGHIQVMLTNTVPTLTPLLVSNPADNFDPGDPWFTALDPSARGASFSRRYGFMWDNYLSDALPANTEVWIRKLSSSPGLNAYRYAEFEPKAFAPIFGTDGTPGAMMWNRMMFHPCFTAAPGTNTFTAEFEVYLANTTTGQEVPNSSTDTITFNFNNLPDGRPELLLAPKILVGWSENASTNWVLERASSPNSAAWTPVTNAPVAVEGHSAVVLDNSAAQQYFRMRYVP